MCYSFGKRNLLPLIILELCKPRFNLSKSKKVIIIYKNFYQFLPQPLVKDGSSSHFIEDVFAPGESSTPESKHISEFKTRI